MSVHSGQGEPCDRLSGLLEDWTRNPAWIDFVRKVLDKRDRTGRFPKTILWTPEHGSGLGQILPPAALRVKESGRIRIDLDRIARVLAAEAADRGRPSEPLEAVFDRLAGRDRRDLRAEATLAARSLREALSEGLREGRLRASRSGYLGCGETPGERPGETSERPGETPGETSGEGTRPSPDRADTAYQRLEERLLSLAEPSARVWRRLYREGGPAAVQEAAARLAAAFLIARHHDRGTLRLDHLSLAVAGETKAMRPGGADHQRLADALLEAEEAEEEEEGRGGPGRGEAPASSAFGRRLALERLGVVSNDAPLEVLLQGPLTITVAGTTLRDAAELARLGMPYKLTYGLLRKGRPHVPAGTAVVSVENESAFHVLAAAWPDALTIYTGGQPAWSVILLLRRLGAAQESATARASRTDFFHAGDLDRSGLLILRSMRRRSGVPSRPLWMDAATFDACRDLAVPMTAAEMTRTKRLGGLWHEPYGADLLERLIETGRWIEKEAVLHLL